MPLAPDGQHELRSAGRIAIHPEIGRRRDRSPEQGLATGRQEDLVVHAPTGHDVPAGRRHEVHPDEGVRSPGRADGGRIRRHEHAAADGVEPRLPQARGGRAHGDAALEVEAVAEPHGAGRSIGLVAGAGEADPKGSAAIVGDRETLDVGTGRRRRRRSGESDGAGGGCRQASLHRQMRWRQRDDVDVVHQRVGRLLGGRRRRPEGKECSGGDRRREHRSLSPRTSSPHRPG